MKSQTVIGTVTKVSGTAPAVLGYISSTPTDDAMGYVGSELGRDWQLNIEHLDRVTEERTILASPSRKMEALTDVSYKRPLP